MTQITVAATQMACSWDTKGNIARAEQLVRKAHARGAQIVLLQELFETPYFCQQHNVEHLALASPLAENQAVQHFQSIAAELHLVLPISFYERHNNGYYNSIAIIDADGTVLGVYRKSHIPDGPGYSEKFYFTPGDTGFKVWDTQYGRIGVGICWDQWFPETARAMALMGAELLFFPTAIGSEPQDPTLDSRPHWQNTQCGHAAANVMPLIASNRIGTETQLDSEITFYGSSFIADETGHKQAEMNTTSEGIIIATFNLDLIRQKRHAWGVFRDRRPDLYHPLLTKDGATRP